MCLGALDAEKVGLDRVSRESVTGEEAWPNGSWKNVSGWRSSNRPIGLSRPSARFRVSKTGWGELDDTVLDVRFVTGVFVAQRKKMCTPISRVHIYCFELVQAGGAASPASLLARLMSAETVSDASRRVWFDRWL